MKVTGIEAQVKTKGRYSIFVDGKFSFGLSELGLIESGIRIGHEVDDRALAALKEDAKLDKIYNLALSLIMRRPRSRWELDDYLRRKEIAPEAAAQIMERLAGKGYIDDEDFARRWVDNRRLLKSISKRKLIVELKQKRISDSIIKVVLDEDETDEVEVIRAEIEKKRRQTRYQDETKLMQYLARQGYRYDDIKRALSDDAG